MPGPPARSSARLRPAGNCGVWPPGGTAAARGPNPRGAGVFPLPGRSGERRARVRPSECGEGAWRVSAPRELRLTERLPRTVPIYKTGKASLGWGSMWVQQVALAVFIMAGVSLVDALEQHLCWWLPASGLLLRERTLPCSWPAAESRLHFPAACSPCSGHGRGQGMHRVTHPRPPPLPPLDLPALLPGSRPCPAPAWGTEALTRPWSSGRQRFSSGSSFHTLTAALSFDPCQPRPVPEDCEMPLTPTYLSFFFLQLY